MLNNTTSKPIMSGVRGYNTRKGKKRAVTCGGIKHPTPLNMAFINKITRCNNANSFKHIKMKLMSKYLKSNL